jgi:Zn-dependent peptidase ImmA (M78 family)
MDSVGWYLLPLFEWFAKHWEPLFHEERPPVDVAGASAWKSLQNSRFPPAAKERSPEEASEWQQKWSTWWQRHALQACREGGIFPDIVFRRWREQIEISWGPTRVAGQPEHFQFNYSEGFSRLTPTEVAEPVYEALGEGLEYLERQVQDSERFERLRQRLNEIPDTPVGRRLMWVAGLGVDEESVSRGWEELDDCVEQIDGAGADHLLEPPANELVVEGSPAAAMMFGTVAPDIGKADKLALLEFVLSSTGSEETRVDREAGHRPLGAERVWEQGYDLALELLERFEVIENDTVCLDIEELIRNFDIRLEEKPLEDTKVRGVAIAGDNHRPGILINSSHISNGYRSGRRFTIAHELCHLFHARGLGDSLALVSGEWAPQDIEKRANAFAAMLLMPPVLVERALDEIDGELSDADDAIWMADRLGTSTTALLRHLNNTDYLDDATFEGIQLELDERRQNP